MKKFLFFILFAVLSFAASALSAVNTPTSILDEAVKKFNSGGGVNIGFTLSAEGNTTSGNIRMLGKKFCQTAASISIDDHVVMKILFDALA